MGWKVVEINTDEYVQLYLNNLMIKRLTEKILINISDIDTLIINNDRLTLSAKLINALTASNINVILMNGYHEPATYFLPVVGNHMSLKILERQIQWNHEFKGRIWQAVIKNKINNQRSLLAKVNNERNDYFNSLIEKVKHYDITNREGHAAKVYWHTLFGTSFVRDQKGYRNSLINSMLNYGYAIIRSLVIRSIVKKGLDPRISLFHKSVGNFFALASDLMEPYRQLVDEVIYRNRKTKIFTIEIRDELIGLCEQKVMIKGTKQYLNNAVDLTIDAMVKQSGWEWLVIWD